ncbi:MAG: type II toxin-antitoxin system mRNA interferase toxin, RelE/StbE family, partial [bacterium (Candidatus Ratteibacteria) CG01_land_8_20_14_3_00_40_19]
MYIKIIPRAQKDLDKLEEKLFNDIKDKIGSLKNNPRPPGCEKLTDEEGYRIRV